jgi:hypothetical protein
MEETNKPAGIEKLAAALAKAQSKFTNPEKNRTVKVTHKAGGSHSYSYATLDEVLNCTRGPLSENGLAFVQLVTTQDGSPCLITKLIHESGQEIEAVYMLPTGLGVQEFGAAITYARRYCACPMLGIAGETDTDGEEAQAAQETADEARKAAAAEKVKAMAAEGRLKSAHTGKTIKPEDVKADGSIGMKPEVKPEVKPGKKPEAKPEVKPGPEPEEDNLPMDFPTDPDPVIDERLRKKLAESRLTLREFRAWGVGKGNIPADMQMDKLNPTFVDTVLKQWDSVAKSIRAFGEANK